MPDFLEATFDKFTFRVATDRLYTPDGVWLQVQPDGRVRLGVSDFLQQHSGDVAFISVKAAGIRLAVGEDFAEMETIKVNQSLTAPVAGTIVAANPALDLNPEDVNQDPYGRGWLALLEPANWASDRAGLLDAQAYLATMRVQVEQERRRS